MYTCVCLCTDVCMYVCTHDTRLVCMPSPVSASHTLMLSLMLLLATSLLSPDIATQFTQPACPLSMRLAIFRPGGMHMSVTLSLAWTNLFKAVVFSSSISGCQSFPSLRSLKSSQVSTFLSLREPEKKIPFSPTDVHFLHTWKHIQTNEYLNQFLLSEDDKFDQL